LRTSLRTPLHTQRKLILLVESGFKCRHHFLNIVVIEHAQLFQTRR
jgi:hypothetical protein